MQLQGTESSVYIDLLRLFAHGTWTDYKSKEIFSWFVLLYPVLLFLKRKNKY